MSRSGTTLRAVVEQSGTSTRLTGLRVRVQAKSGRKSVGFADGITNADGRVQIQLGHLLQQQGRDWPTSFQVAVWQADVELEVDSGLTGFAPDRIPADVVYSVVVPEAAVLPDDPVGSAGSSPSVRGLVRFHDGSPVVGVRLRVFVRELGGTTELDAGTTATTDADGVYELAITESSGSPWDIFVRAVDTSTTPETVLATSRIVLDAPSAARVDLMVKRRGLVRPASSFVRLTKALEPMLGASVGWTTSTFTDLSFDDLLYISQKRRLSLSALSDFVAAWRIQDQLQLTAPEAAYAMVRSLATANVVAILEGSREDAEQLLLTAAASNLVPQSVADDAATHVGELADARVATAFATDRPRRLGALLAPIGLTTAQKQALLAAHDEFPHQATAFWDAVEADPAFSDPADVTAVRRSLELGVLTLNHAPLVHRLMTELGSDPLSDMVSWDTTTWLSHLSFNPGGGEIGTPAYMPGASPAERKGHYADILIKLVGRAFPSHKALAELSGFGSADFAIFRADPDTFDFRTTHITTSVATRPGVSDPAALAVELRAMQRVFRICPSTGRGGTMQALIGEGLTSARRVARMGRERLRAALSPTVSTAVSDQIYARAQTLRSVAVSVHTAVSGSLLSPITRMMDETSDLESTAVIADFETIFGSPQSCRCSSCQSMFSPSAYFAELMSFVDQREAMADLLSRRPDLQTLQLSCQSAETLLPHIDLVLEILENHPDLQNVTNIEHDATTVDATSLLATPEYFNPEAYGTVAEDWRAPGLPYDLWLHRARVFLGQLGTDRAALMRVFQKTATGGADVPTMTDRATEALGLSTLGRNVISGVAGTGYSLWGYGSGMPGGTAWEDRLRSVGELQRQGQLSVDEVLDLLHVMSTMGSPRLAWPETESCDLDEIELVDAGGTVDAEAAFTSWGRFLRLWRATGWTALDLRVVLQALEAGAITSTSVPAVGWIKSLCLRTGLSPRSMAGWYYDLDRYGDRQTRAQPVLSEYDRVFLSPSLLSPNEPSAFRLGGSPELSAVHAAHLQAALGIDETQLAMALPWAEELLSATLEVTLSHLSMIFRLVRLSQAVGMSVDDTRALVALSGVDPFSNPKQTLDFLELAETWQSVPFDLSSIRYLAAHEGAGCFAPPYDDTLLQTLLGRVRDLMTQQISVWSPAPATELLAAVADQVAALVAEVFGLDPLVVDAFRGLSGAVQLAEETDFTFDDFTECFVESDFAQSGPGVTTPWDDLVRESEDLAIERAFGMADKLGKIFHVVGVLGLDAQTCVWWATHLLSATPSLFRIVGPMSLPNRELSPLSEADGRAQGLVELCRVLHLANRVPGEQADDVTLLGTFEAGTSAQVRDALVSRAGFSAEDLNELLSEDSYGYRASTGHQVSAQWLRMLDALTLVEQTGASAVKLSNWAAASLSQVLSDEIIATVRGRYGTEEEWVAVARPLRDALRRAQRDALVSYLVVGSQGTLADADALYEQSLIDVAMQPEAMTSRLVQATASVQQFIQRWMLGLEAPEEAQVLTREDREQWAWKKNYRVWEAALKVFVYPENWLEPELRRDRSPPFQELQKSLGKGELSEFTVESAVAAYLEGLMELSDIRVLCIYEHKDEAAGVDDLHLVGRTRGTPARVLHRVWKNRSDWTPWRPVTAGVQGDNVTCMVSNDRLYVFWVEFESTQTGDTSAIEYWNVRLGWSELRDEDWSSARKSDEPLSTVGVYTKLGGSSAGDDQANYHLQTVQETGAIAVAVSYFEQIANEGSDADPSVPDDSDTVVWSHRIGRFVVDLATLRTVVEQEDWVVTHDLGYEAGDPSGDRTVYPHPKGGRAYHQGFRLHDGATELSIARAPVTLLDLAFPETSMWEHLKLLRDLAGATDMVVPDQYGPFVGQAPCVVQSWNESFLVLPVAFEEAAISFPEDEVNPDLEADVIAGAVGLEFDNARTQSFEESVHLSSGLISSTESIADTVLEQYYGLDGEMWPGRAEEMYTSFITGGSQAVMMATRQYTASTPGETTASMTQLVLTKQATSFLFLRLSNSFLTDFLRALRVDGVWGLYDPLDDVPAEDPEAEPNTLARQQLHADDFISTFDPNPDYVELPVPLKEISFDSGDAWGAYHWELFYHVPMLLSKRLAADGRYQEALRWLQSILDPTNQNTDYEGTSRFWRIKPFLDTTPDTVDLWSAVVGDQASTEAVDQFLAQMAAWTENPFDPHAIARLRPVAYQRAAFMAYLDVLLDWADDLYQRDTRESTNEATQLYVLARRMLGQRPTRLPVTSTPEPWTWQSLQAALSTGEDALETIENSIAGWVELAAGNSASTFDLPTAMAFCLPQNDVMLAYWDRVEDRLYKLRHCLDLDGRFRVLPLFSPPLDPALLVAASAAGVSIESVLSTTSVELPHHRFTVMLERARALTGNVRGLGSMLLQALEKQDGEALAVLRADQELTLLEAGVEVRSQRIAEARQSLRSAEQALRAASLRQRYYERLLDTGLLPLETEALQLTREGSNLQYAASMISAAIAVEGLIPQVTGTSTGPQVEFGGVHLANAAQGIASGMGAVAAHMLAKAGANATVAGYARRKEEWRHQGRQAAVEIRKAQADVAAAQLRVAIAQRELEDFRLQLAQSRQVREWMESKYTRQELYDWMAGELAALHYSSYQLALDVGRQAEACFRWERAQPSASYIGYSYWDAQRKGLLAADRLQLDLDRMERDFLSADRREFELTRHLSLDELDPVALLQLRHTGTCTFHTPEVAFDLDFPGHYLRRIRSVAVTVPCVSGGFLNLSAELSFTGGSTRVDDEVGSELVADDARGATATPDPVCLTTGQQDSGLFQMDLADPRYLPFERRGLHGQWTLRLTSPYPSWDPSSIADAVLHLRYTALEGGGTFLEDVEDGLLDAWEALPSAASPAGPRRAYLLSRDFPEQWAAFLQAMEGDTAHEVTLSFSRELAPGLVQSIERTLSASDPPEHVVIEGVQLFCVLAEGITYAASEWLQVKEDEAAYVDVEPETEGSPVDSLPWAELTWTPTDGLDVEISLKAAFAGLESTGIEKESDFDEEVFVLDPAKLKDIILVLQYSTTTTA